MKLLAILLHIASLSICTCQQSVSRGQVGSIISSKSPGLFGDVIDGIFGIGNQAARGYVASGASSQQCQNLSSTFNGWGTPIGVLSTPANFFDVRINAWDQSNFPTVLALQVLSISNTGPVLATGYASLSGLKLNVDTMVRVYVDSVVAPVGQVYVRYWADGHIGQCELDSPMLYPPSTFAATVYSTGTGFTSMPSWSNTTGQQCLYVRYGLGSVSTSFDNGSLQTTSFQYVNSTETAYGAPTGSIGQSFNRVQFDILCGTTSAAPLPTCFRCNFKLGSSSGVVLASKVIYNIGLIPGQQRRITFDLPNSVSGPNLWVELIANGRFACRTLAINTFPEGAFSQAQYQTYGSIDYPNWSNDGAQFTPYFRASYVDWANVESNGPDDFAANLEVAASNLYAPTSLVTRNLYGCSGLEMFVSTDAMLGYPNAHETMHDQPYTVTFSCTKGVLYSDRWTYTPNSGDSTCPLTFTVSFGGVQELVTRPNLNFTTMTSGSYNRKVLVIGDSTDSNPGNSWLAEFVRLSAIGSGGLFTLVGANLGTNDPSPALTSGIDSVGTLRNINCEAWPGQTASFFFTGLPTVGSYNRGHGPFYIAGAFNFAGYLSNNSISMSSGDWVLIDLLTNDVINSSSDASAWASVASYLFAMSGMITNIQSAVPGIRIGIMLPPAWAGQDGFAYTYGNYSISAARARRNRDLGIEAALSLWDTASANSNNIWVIPTHLGADPVNDYPQTTIAQGQYNPTIRQVQANSVHLAPWGYYRKAATVYAFLKNQG